MARRFAGVTAAAALVLGSFGVSGSWAATASGPGVGAHVHPSRPAPAGPLPKPTSTRGTHPAEAAGLPAVQPFAQPPAFADTFTVDTQSDPAADTSCAPGHAEGACSLRAAVVAADAEPAGSMANIVIPAGYDIVLSQGGSLGPLDLTASMVITGNGSTVDGDAVEVFDQYNSPSVEITGLTVTNGVTTGDGGGMYVSNGALVLSQDTFTANTAADGGGIYTASDAQLWVDHGLFTKNVATGGLAFSAPARVSALPNDVYAHGDGGGMYTYGSANIRNTVFGGPNPEDGNMAQEGAGLYNYDGDVSVTGTTFQNNSSPSTFGYGVALYNDELMDLSNSTITDNAAPYGADGVGLDTEYVMTIENTSFTSNTAGGDYTTYGGAIYDDGDVTTLTNVNLTGNSVTPTGGRSVYGGAVLSYAYNFTWDGGTISGQTNGTDGDSSFIEGGALYLDGSHAVVSNLKISGTTNSSMPNEYPEGGAVYINEYTSLSNVDISGTANTGYDVYGGAIYNDDYATISDVKITGTDNHATDALGGYIAGGAIYNDGENFALTNLSVDGTTNLADTGSEVASGNASEVDGGVLYNDYEATATNVSFTNTTSNAVGGSGYVYGGGLYNSESLLVNNFQVVGTNVQADSYVEGGILYNNDRLQGTNFTLGNGTVAVLGGDFAGTPYADGSIFYNDSQANLTNTTIADITSSVPSGGSYNWGIENDDLLQLTNSTIARDPITGPPEGTWLLYGYGSSQASLRNSIVASADPTENCSTGAGSGVILSAGYNLENGSTCGFNSPQGDLSGVADPLVADLADNGGPVFTAALEAHSPAIDAASDVGCPPTDARGVPRPQGAHCDIGAFEVIADPVVSSVSPGQGPPQGGTSVTVTGEHFTGATQVLFGSTAVDVPAGSTDTSITVTSPPGSGTVSVAVKTPWATGAVTGTFTYTGGGGVVFITTGGGGGGAEVLSCPSDGPGNLPTAGNLLTATVGVPGGTGCTGVSFSETTGSSLQPPAGFSVLGFGMQITAPVGSGINPLQLFFQFPASQLPPGTGPSDVTVFRDGVPVASPCTITSPLSPDPCEVGASEAGGVVTIEVLSSHASLWNFAASMAPGSSRLSGLDREATAIAISNASFAQGGAGAVVLAGSSDYADALAGSALAVARNAPILLTSSGTLDGPVAAEIQRVLPAGGTVYLLGGPSALADSVAAHVGGLGYTVTRYAGADRFATAVAIAQAAGPVNRVLLADGVDFPDALSASAATGTPGTVVLLTSGPSLPAAAAGFLAANQVPTFAIGGPAAQADPYATPLVGADRYATAVALAQRFFSAPTAAGLATGLAFPDALAAGPRLAHLGMPLLLTDPNALPTSVAGYLGAVKSTLKKLEVVGGTTAVSPAVQQAALTAIGG